MVSPLIGRVNLNEDVNMHKTWSVPDNNMVELTVLPGVLHQGMPHQRSFEMTWIVVPQDWTVFPPIVQVSE